MTDLNHAYNLVLITTYWPVLLTSSHICLAIFVGTTLISQNIIIDIVRVVISFFINLEQVKPARWLRSWALALAGFIQ